MNSIFFAFTVALAFGGEQEVDKMGKKDAHWDAKERGLAPSDVTKLRTIAMKGQRVKRPRKGRYSKVFGYSPDRSDF